MATISILLPFYQASATLESAVKSIVEQTYTDWELLLIDNNSNDGGLAIAEKWAGLDSRVKLLHEPKQGICFALNKGLSVAIGKLIARMDADDISVKHRFEKQVQFLQHNPEVEVVSCQCEFNSHGEKSEGYHLFVNWQNSIITSEDHFINRFIESPIAHPSVLFYKSLIDRYGKYSEEAIPEDYELWLRWMERGVKIAKVEERLLIWNDSSDRLSRQHKNYSAAAFFKVKSFYLSKWLKRHVDPSVNIITCGTSKECLQRISMLEQYGVAIYAVTVVRNRILPERKFVEAEKLLEGERKFIINLITKRGVNKSIRKFLAENGYIEGVDFILAG